MISNKVFLRGTLIAIVSAWFVNAILFYITKGLGMLPDEVLVIPFNEPLSLFGVLTDSTIFAVAGAIVYRAFIEWVDRPVHRFNWLAFFVVLVGFAYPLLIPDIPLNMYVALNLMHIFGGLVVVLALTRLAAPAEVAV